MTGHFPYITNEISHELSIILLSFLVYDVVINDLSKSINTKEYEDHLNLDSLVEIEFHCYHLTCQNRKKKKKFLVKFFNNMQIR